MHPCILDTFSFYLESVEGLPSKHRLDHEGQWPKSALTLATIAVSTSFPFLFMSEAVYMLG